MHTCPAARFDCEEEAALHDAPSLLRFTEGGHRNQQLSSQVNLYPLALRSVFCYKIPLVRNTVLACATCLAQRRCVRCPRINVKTLYSLAGVKSYCVHEPTGTVQMDTLPHFIKSTVQGLADTNVRKKLKDWAPAAAMDGKLMGRLMRIAGAVDLLQAIARRSIHPLGTTESCTVRGCNHVLSIEHILLADDQRHLKHIAITPRECDITVYFPRPLKGRPSKTLTASAHHGGVRS